MGENLPENSTRKKSAKKPTFQLIYAADYGIRDDSRWLQWL